MRSNGPGARMRRPLRVTPSIVVTSLSLLGALMMTAAPPALAGPLAPLVAEVSAGNRDTCALTAGGGVSCWGYNGNGNLGDGTTTDRYQPVSVSGLSSGVAEVSAGGSTTCAVTTGGAAKCWGSNYSGQLGDGTNAGSNIPVSVSGLSSGVAAISSGHGHTCAVTTGGGVKCWGSNASGQLGDGTNTDSNVPVAVSGLSSGVAAVSAGVNHTCALTTGGGVKCWGENAAGELGDGTNTGRKTPVAVSGLSSGVVAVAAGQDYTCALTTGGGVKCWGENLYGGLGNGTNTDSNVPVSVSGLTSGVAALSAAYHHSCAVTTGGGVKCWGRDASHELGDGNSVDSNVPVDVATLSSGVGAVTAGGSHTCALTTGGGVKCWGDNWYGELGDGASASGVSPVDVVWYTSSLTFSATPTALDPGTTTSTLSGDLDMDGAGTLLGQTIQITRTNPDLSTTDVSTTTDAYGHFSIDDSLYTHGTYGYAATWVPDVDHTSPGTLHASVLVNRITSSLTLKASKKTVPYNGKVKLAVHLGSPTYAHTPHHVVDLAVTPIGKSTFIKHITIDSAGDGSISLALKRNTSFNATFSDPACCTVVSSKTVKVGVTIAVIGQAVNYYGKSGTYFLYHYTSACPGSGKGCPTFVISTSPPQGGKVFSFQMQLYYSGSWHTLFTQSYSLNGKGKATIIVLYSSTKVEGGKARVRGFFASKAISTSTGNWVYFEVTK